MNRVLRRNTWDIYVFLLPLVGAGISVVAAPVVADLVGEAGSDVTGILEPVTTGDTVSPEPEVGALVGAGISVVATPGLSNEILL
jgi:hypothetical protein